MKIYATNIYGGKSNTDLLIHASGEGFNELRMFCDAVLEAHEGKDYSENTTTSNVLKIARALQEMMMPLDKNPKKYFSTERKGE